MRKKKILVQCDFALAKSGFGRAMKCLLTYLYKTGKYEIVHFCCGINYSNQVLQKTPWKSIGTLPDSQQEIDAINKDPVLQRDANYGGYLIEKVIAEEKPDIYIGSQDIWAFPDYQNKFWWNKIPCVIWTTLDSLPLLPAAVEAAPKITNYWMWSSFAEKEMHRLGHKHVKTVHGPLDDTSFYKLSESKKNELRSKSNIPKDAFITAFIFRNQLRKSVPQLLEGFSLFKKNNPECKSPKLLLHTSYSEGWNINRLAGEYNVPQEDILTTYVCKTCGDYEIKSFAGEEQNCKYCHGQKCMSTTNVGKGVSEKQLNEIYNVADVYCHPISSGGQELPVIEAKLAELITLVTNYSCGEELCEEGSGSMVLDWTEYREFGTEFRKSSTIPSSISKQLSKVWKMDKGKRAEIGRASRKWAVDNYSIGEIGKFFEDFLDIQEIVNFNFKKTEDIKNPDAKIPEIENNGEWVKALYKGILNMDVGDTDQGFSHWMTQMKNGMSRKDVEAFFKNVAVQENAKKIKTKDLSEFLDETGRKKYLLVLKESIGDIFMATSLLRSIKELYFDHDIYFAADPQYFEILDGNPYIYKCIPYAPLMESEIAMTGNAANKGYFDVYCNLALATQKQLNYLTQERFALELI